MEHKRKLPPDGCLEPITSSIISNNVMIIRVPDEMKKPGETTYQLATLDRNKEGIEWPADRYIDKLIPNLPKVKVPEEDEPEVCEAKTSNKLPYRRKRIRRYVKRDSKPKSSISRHKKPSQKKHRFDFRQGYPQSADSIEPWVQKPWESQSFFEGMNNCLPINNSVSKNALFDNFHSQNLVTVPYNSGTNKFIGATTDGNSYRNILPTRTYVNNARNQTLMNNMLVGPRMPISPSSTPLIVDTPAANANLYCDNLNKGLLGNNHMPILSLPNSCPPSDIGTFNNEHPSKQGLLGDFPSSNRLSFAGNRIRFPAKSATNAKTCIYSNYPNRKTAKDNFVSNVNTNHYDSNHYDSNHVRSAGHGPSIDSYEDHRMRAEHFRNIDNSGNNLLIGGSSEVGYDRFPMQSVTTDSSYENTFIEHPSCEQYENDYDENPISSNTSYVNKVRSTRNESSTNIPKLVSRNIKPKFQKTLKTFPVNTRSKRNKELSYGNNNITLTDNSTPSIQAFRRPWNANKNQIRTSTQFNKNFRGRNNSSRWKPPHQ